MSNTIVLGEPQCWDFEHSRVNASLIHTALLAYPDAHILFLGERSHVVRVRELLAQQASGEARRVEWRDLVIPPRHARTLARLRAEASALRSVLDTARNVGGMTVVLTSATESGLLILKVLLGLTAVSIPVFVVMHGALATLLPGTPRKRFAPLRGMRLVFRLPHPRRLHYVALGPSIFRSLSELQPKAARHTFAMELPFSWQVHQLPAISGTAPTPVCFGFFGVSGGRGKRFDRFAHLAADALGQNPDIRFTLVGHLSTEADRSRYCKLLPDAPCAPLSQEEYGRRASAVTYAVSANDPDVYRVCASTSFLDALSSLKPGIYLRNPYLEEYFQRMGDIGYLCDSVDEVRSCILEVVREFPIERYRKQCENIVRGRHIFEPASISSSFRNAVEQARTHP